MPLMMFVLPWKDYLVQKRQKKMLVRLKLERHLKYLRFGTIAGCQVKSGKITRNSRIRLFRDDVEVYEGTLSP